MKNSDEVVKRVLSGLRDAAAPDGMEQRILRAVEERVAAYGAELGWWQWQRVWIATLTWRGIAAGALAGVVAVCVFSLLWMHTSAGSLEERASATKQASSAKPPVAIETKPPMTTRRSALHEVCERSREARGLLHKGRMYRAEPDAAVQTALVVSYPAPPMPLTEQEKLLLRIVHKGDPVELAMLEPEMRVRQNAEGKAEFQKFFEPAGEPVVKGENK